MDMAEKDESEGRCPACRSAYEKDKIVAMQTNCERAVMKNCNKKSKPLKAKPKTTEVKKDLTSVRVIQRKMAYIIGLRLSVADENIAPVYLASCMKQGLGLLETLLNKQPVQHHQVLLKVEYAKVLS